jgi:CO dehydrogenase/acetyl-CoA synthase beta subunit
MLVSILLQSYASINEQATKAGNEIYQHALIRNLLICGCFLFVAFILPELIKNKDDEK